MKCIFLQTVVFLSFVCILISIALGIHFVSIIIVSLAGLAAIALRALVNHWNL